MEFLVQADTAPQLKAFLTRHDTGEELDLTDDTVIMRVRKRHSTTTLFTLTGGGTAEEIAEGEITFTFGSNLTGLEGFYEGQIQITYGSSQIESVYELVQFQIRAEFL